MEKDKALCAKLLEKFEIAEKVEPDDLNNFKSGTSQIYARGPIYIFNYKKSRFYIVNDYSLGDDPKMVENILLESKHLLKGGIVKSPVHYTSEGSKYTYGFEGEQYYLWEEPRT